MKKIATILVLIFTCSVAFSIDYDLYKGLIMDDRSYILFLYESNNSNSCLILNIFPKDDDGFGKAQLSIIRNDEYYRIIPNEWLTETTSIVSLVNTTKETFTSSFYREGYNKSTDKYIASIFLMDNNFLEDFLKTFVEALLIDKLVILDIYNVNLDGSIVEPKFDTLILRMKDDNTTTALNEFKAFMEYLY